MNSYCLSCDRDTVGAKFCAECGSKRPETCPSCGAALPGTGKFCVECGASLAALSAGQDTVVAPPTPSTALPATPPVLPPVAPTAAALMPPSQPPAAPPIDRTQPMPMQSSTPPVGQVSPSSGGFSSWSYGAKAGVAAAALILVGAIIAAVVLSGGGKAASNPSAAAAAAGSAPPPPPPVVTCAKTWNSSLSSGNTLAELIGAQAQFGQQAQDVATVSESLQTSNQYGCVLSEQTSALTAADTSSWVQIIYPPAGPVALISTSGGPNIAQSTDGDQAFTGLGTENITAASDGSIKFIGGLAAYNKDIGRDTSQATAPPVTSSTGGDTSPAQTTSSGSPEAYAARVQGVINHSRRQLNTMVAAIGRAQAAPDTEALTASQVVGGRQALLDRVRYWSVPGGASQVQRQLVRSLQLSLISDQAYETWMQDLAGGDQAGANQEYAKAQQNDPVATAEKKVFLRSYNAFRISSGLPPIPTKPLF